MSAWKTHARWAAAAWVGVAALQAIIVYGSLFFPPEQPSLVFVASTLVSLITAGLLAAGPSSRVLLAAIVWAGMSLVLGLWAMPTGAAGLGVPLGLLLVVAGLASYWAWRRRRVQA
jgi:hypothetical protein